MISQGMPPACHRGDGSGEYFCDTGVAKKTVNLCLVNISVTEG